MNTQSNKVQNAIDIMHSRYSEGNKKYLDKVDKVSKQVTITITDTELEMLVKYVSNRIGQLHNDWFEATHDEAISEADLAYDLAQIQRHEDQVQRLYKKLTNI